MELAKSDIKGEEYVEMNKRFAKFAKLKKCLRIYFKFPN